MFELSSKSHLSASAGVLAMQLWSLHPLAALLLLCTPIVGQADSPP